MAKVTFEATQGVWVSVNGESRDDPHSRYFNDDGLVRDLCHFLMDNQIYRVPKTSGYSGGGRYGGFFTPEDAEKVIAWLREQGVVEVD